MCVGGQSIGVSWKDTNDKGSKLQTVALAVSHEIGIRVEHVEFDSGGRHLSSHPSPQPCLHRGCAHRAVSVPVRVALGAAKCEMLENRILQCTDSPLTQRSRNSALDIVTTIHIHINRLPTISIGSNLSTFLASVIRITSDLDR